MLLYEMINVHIYSPEILISPVDSMYNYTLVLEHTLISLITSGENSMHLLQLQPVFKI